MRVAVLQSNYVPWKGYFDLIRSVDVFCFYDEVQYTKNDWRNRNRIKSKNGSQWLTIPIPADAAKMKISEVKITDQNWQKDHRKKLQYCYGKAPFYSQLESLMDDYLVKQEWKFLSQLNQYLVRLISEKLSLNTNFLDSSQFQLSEGKIQRLIDLLIQIGAKTYVSGPGGASYLEESKTLFLSHTIQIEYFDYKDYPVYEQLSDPFEDNVSILDLIANVPYDEIPNYIDKR